MFSSLLTKFLPTRVTAILMPAVWRLFSRPGISSNVCACGDQLCRRNVISTPPYKVNSSEVNKPQKLERCSKPFTIVREECCGNPGSNLLARFDALYYKCMDKTDRCYKICKPMNCKPIDIKQKISAKDIMELPPLPLQTKQKSPATSCAFYSSILNKFYALGNNPRLPTVTERNCIRGCEPPSCKPSNCQKECCSYRSLLDCCHPWLTSRKSNESFPAIVPSDIAKRYFQHKTLYDLLPPSRAWPL